MMKGDPLHLCTQDHQLFFYLGEGCPYCELQSTLKKTEQHLLLAQRALERLALCPDHRDKYTGRCIVCVAEERTRRELKEPTPCDL